MKKEHDKVEEILRQEEDIQKKLKQEQVTEAVCVRNYPHIDCHGGNKSKPPKLFCLIFIVYLTQKHSQSVILDLNISIYLKRKHHLHLVSASFYYYFHKFT